MKNKSGIFSLVVLAAIIYGGYSFAGSSEKMVIQLKTDDFELTETDISDLQIGESETIVTDSGQAIDLLRTAEGVEIYVDGELLEMPHEVGHSGQHDADGNYHKSIIIECEVEAEADTEVVCGDEMVFLSDGDIDIDALQADGEAHEVFVKRIHKECVSDNEGECGDHHAWISEGEDAEFGESHKVIRIHRSHDSDVDIETEVDKVIVIEKDG